MATESITKQKCSECDRMYEPGTSRGHSIACPVGNRVAQPKAQPITVEEALRELRKMFPNESIQVTVSVWDWPEKQPPWTDGTEAKILIGLDREWIKAPTLSEAMAQVREWHQNQSR